ncbi:MAG: cytidine deaminase [Gracilimonas sp.]|uniref:cytidine deaminase n=1 Tax=Gracilimonas sp. TaxID=1974203 RepID=UPI003751D2FE|nr:cytidine deaminase [Gracilimonas sp.]
MNWSTLNERTYAPYSGKAKACVVESRSGKLFAGVRVENISYPITIPAVQAACTICLSEKEIPAKLYLEDDGLNQLHFWKKEFNLKIVKTDSLPELPVEDLYHNLDADLGITNRLKELLNQAVIPNSDFPVSALLFTSDGYLEGVNVEVSDWSKGLCAERVVLSKAIAAGVSEFTRLEIHAKKGEISSPCGACRQVIAEFLPYHDIILHHADGTSSEHLTLDLLPFNFKSSSLKKINV